MPKRNYDTDDSEEYNNDYTTGEYSRINELFDNTNLDLDESDDEESIEDEIVDPEFDEEANPDNSMEDLLEEPKPAKVKKGISNVKPKLMGKHSLAHDNIFKGKKTDSSKEPQEEYIIKNVSGSSFELGEDTMYYAQTRNSHEGQRSLKLQQDIFNCLKNNTDLKFTGSRRKPSQYDLNNYYKILLNDLSENGYSYTEIFTELSQYFSDNIWSIFLILQNNYKDRIISELVEKYGSQGLDQANFL